MAIDPEKLLSWPFAEVEQSYSVKDAILYALGIGVGYDPKDRSQLPFLFEEADFQVFPTMAAVLAWPGFWLRDPATGVDWRKVLHGEQGLRIHKPLPPSATVKARTKVTRVLDKGAGKGALIYFDRLIIDQANGEALATASATAFGPRRWRFRRGLWPAAVAAYIAGTQARYRLRFFRQTPTPPSFIGFPAIRTRCTSTRRSRLGPDSKRQFCTGFAPSVSPPTRSCAAIATTM